MPPKRRETDEEKELRDQRAKDKRAEMIAHSQPISQTQAIAMRPRINAGGKLSL